MECTIQKSNISAFKSAIQCLNSVNDEFMIEATPKKFTLRSLCSSQAAYLQIDLSINTFFNEYTHNYFNKITPTQSQTISKLSIKSLSNSKSSHTKIKKNIN